MSVFDSMGVYWSEIADRNQTESQIQFLENTLKANCYVLDLACGTGRHSIRLTQHGYSIVGLDVSGSLLHIAKQQYGKVQVVKGDMRFLPFKPQAFSAVISMDTSFGYLPSERDDLQSFIEARRALMKDGILVVDVFNRQRLSRISPERKTSNWTEYPSFFLQQKRTVNPSGDRLFDEWVVRDRSNGRLIKFVHSVHLYKINELQTLLERAEFAVSRVYGDYKRQAFSADSPRLILIAIAR
jgi:ubiquinone/menaquinone biosynthesis C-methylase UbiE